MERQRETCPKKNSDDEKNIVTIGDDGSDDQNRSDNARLGTPF